MPRRVAPVFGRVRVLQVRLLRVWLLSRGRALLRRQRAGCLLSSVSREEMHRGMHSDERELLWKRSICMLFPAIACEMNG